MKFMTMSVYPVSQTAEVGAASDQVSRDHPSEGAPSSFFVMMSVPFDAPPNSIVAFSIGPWVEFFLASTTKRLLSGISSAPKPGSTLPSHMSGKSAPAMCSRVGMISTLLVLVWMFARWR